MDILMRSILHRDINVKPSIQSMSIEDKEKQNCIENIYCSRKNLASSPVSPSVKTCKERRKCSGSLKYVYEDKEFIREAKNIFRQEVGKGGEWSPPQSPRVEGHLFRLGSSLVRKGFRFFVLDPLNGTFTTYNNKLNFPHKSLETILLRDVKMVKRIDPPWLKNKDCYYFVIVENSKHTFYSKREEHANLWTQYLNNGTVYSNYLNLITETINSHELTAERKAELEGILEGTMINEQITIILESHNEVKTEKIEPKRTNSSNYIYYDKFNTNIYQPTNQVEERKISMKPVQGKEILRSQSLGIEEMKYREGSRKNSKLEGEENINKTVDSYFVSDTLFKMDMNACVRQELKHSKDEQNVEGSMGKMEENKLLAENTVNYDSFKIIMDIGKGSFGRVYKVMKKDSKEVYAMKVLNKSDLLSKKQLKYAISECNILKQMDHPFILKLHYSFQTSLNLYFILDYCERGDLAMNLAHKRTFPESLAKFFIAELILAIQYLHQKNIIHRDLKPENILLDEDGHIKLADFGLATIINNKAENMQNFCGTPAYLSPEMIMLNRAGKSADIYGLGVLLYEFLSGLPPYYNPKRCKMMQQIINAKLEIPPLITKSAADILNKLLRRNPKERIGVLDKGDVKKHKFFAELDWKALEQKKIKSPNLAFMNIDNTN